MKVNEALISNLVSYLNNHLSNAKILKAIFYTNNIIIFVLDKGRKLVLNLEPGNPCIYISTTIEENSSSKNPNLMLFRKEFSNATIINFEQLNQDRVIKINLSCINDVFKKESKSIIVELITNRTNFIEVDDKNIINFVLHPTPITYSRPLIKGLVYHEISKVNPSKTNEQSLSLEEYFDQCNELEKDIVNRRRNEKYKIYFSYVNSKIKSLSRKIKSIESDLKKAEDQINFNEIGDYIYTNYSELKDKNSFDYNGKTYTLDNSKSLSENANDFYKKAKKAKRKLEEESTQLEVAKVDLKEYENLAYLFSVSSEAGIDSIIKNYDLDKIVLKKKKDKVKVSSSLPYEVIINNVVYRFGKNSVQNDLLTFSLETNKNQLFFHLKNQHSSHLIIKKVSPSNKEIETACKLVLALSNLESGEVQYTLHKNIRKGNVPGQVILTSYESAYFNNVEKELFELLNEAKRVNL